MCDELYFFPKVILCISSSFFVIHGDFRVEVLGFGSSIGFFWGMSFQLMGFGACGIGPSVVFGVGALYNKHGRIILGIKMV